MRTKNVAWGTVLLFVLITHAPSVLGVSQERKLVLEIGGIHVGVASQKEVIERYGVGSVIKDEGHGDGRYYTDPTRTVIFHVITGVDYIIEGVELISGHYLGKDFKVVIEKTPTLNVPIPIQHGINLGMSRAEVTKILGDPDEEKATEKGVILKYATDVDEDKRVRVNYDAAYEFENDRLIRVSIHDGC